MPSLFHRAPFSASSFLKGETSDVPALLVFGLGVGLALTRSASAVELEWKIHESSLHVAGKYLDVEFSLSQPQFLRLGVDSLGQGRFLPSALRSPPPRAADHCPAPTARGWNM